MSAIPAPLALGIALVSSGAGFGLCGLLGGSASPGNLDRIPPAEYLTHARSFSELETARAELDSRALQLVFEVRANRTAWPRLETAGLGTSERPLHEQLEELEQAAAELRGTGWETTVVRELLTALAADGQLDRWLDLYLDSALRHPGGAVALALAPQAARIGRTTGRQHAVEEALRWMASSPRAGGDHAKVTAALESLAPTTPHGRPAATDSPGPRRKERS